MEKIESFKVDHRYIVPGIYLSRRDADIDTYDLRFKKPNGGCYLDNVEMHSVEHLFATYVRNEAPDKVIYFGPMGCRTGFYLLLKGCDADQARELINRTLLKIVNEAKEMFGMDEIQCGNYKELSLEKGKRCCAEFLSLVDPLKEDLVYPQS